MRARRTVIVPGWCVFAFLLACGSTSSPGPAGAGGNGLTGSYAFPVGGTLLDMQIPQSQCGYSTVLPDGSVGAFAAALSTADSASMCAVYASGGSPPGEAPFVMIQVQGNRLSESSSPAAITPGDYAIGYEAVPDDDLCMLGNGAGALVDVLSFGSPDGGSATERATSLSGSVTVTAISPGHVAGSFDVQLGAVDAAGNIDTQSPTPMTGTFDVSACPGS